MVWVSLVKPTRKAATREAMANPAKNRKAVVNMRERSMAAYFVT